MNPQAATMEAESEEREFRAHPKLLLDVVRRQSGSLHKSVLEAVQNSIDAEARTINIVLEPRQLLITDDGIGFSSRQQILYCFETFGAPHLANEKKAFGQFRMGRGQLFSFGINTWRSGTYQMHVDIEKFVQQGTYSDPDAKNGIPYMLSQGLPDMKGCSIRIKLYEELSPSTLEYTIRDIRRYVKYCKINVVLNKQRISTDPDTLKWDLETDDGYVKLTGAERGLDIYNMGVYVATDYHLGASGIAVSKKRLDVNFARNEIIAGCPVWRNLRKLITSNVSVGLLRKRKLNTEERNHVIAGFLSGEYGGREIENACIFPDITGTFWSAQQLRRRAHKPWTFAQEGSKQGDRVMQMEIGTVLSDQIPHMFDYEGNPARFFDHIRRLRGNNGMATNLTADTYRTLANLLKGTSDRHIALPEKEWSKREKLILSAAESTSRLLAWQISSRTGDRSELDRRLLLGVSDLSDAWTDGSTYICINRKYLARLRNTPEGLIKMAFLLLHEALHDSADTTSHLHTAQFYQEYHNLTDAAVAAGVRLFANYNALVRKRQRKGEDIEAPHQDAEQT